MRSVTMLVLAWSLAALALPQDQPVRTADQKAADLAKTPIDLEGIEMPLAKFLAVLEEKLPAERKVAIRLDEKGLGKDLAKVAGATIQLPRLRGVSLSTILRLALRQVDPDVKLEIVYSPTRFLITRPQLAAYTERYPVGDLVELWPLLQPELERTLGEARQGDDGARELVRLLTTLVTLEPWETIQVLNGTRLVIHATPTSHRQIQDLLDAMRRLQDVGVYMNARLYEVDQAWFAKQVAPLFANKDDPPAAVSIDGALLKKITAHKLVLESESVKIRPSQQARFLSLEENYRYTTGPGTVETGLAGVTFMVRPLVSADRRFLRLRIDQKVSQLVRIDQVKRLDPATGKDVEIEAPNLRAATLTGTVDLPDTGALLMPVDYRPAPAGKVWLLVARPLIWIEEEIQELRKEGKVITPRSAWDWEVGEPDRLPPPLPLNEDVQAVLQAVITDVLTNPDLQNARKFYGTESDKTLILVAGEEIGWPRGFQPAVHGYQLTQPNPFAKQNRILGIRLDRFDLKPKDADVAPIEICLVNAGGHANGGVIGGCTVNYYPKREGKRWTVKRGESIDP